MARTRGQIQAEMDAQQAAQSSLTGLNSPSQAAIYTLWKYITSVAIWTLEMLTDTFKSEVETTLSTAVVGTDNWVQTKVLEFQYSTVTPQIIQLVNFVPAYNPIDTTLQIITRASVKTLANKTVSVKTAKSDPPVALAAAELTSLQGYLDDISFAGVKYNATSATSDKLFLEAEIFYNGQYQATIAADVIAAINLHLANLDFDGFVRVSQVFDAIQAVSGVVDVVINNMAFRADAVAFGSKTFMVQSEATILSKSLTAAGYIVEENTAGETFTDKLTFTPES